MNATFDERLGAPLSWWALAGLFGVAVSWTVVPAAPPAVALALGLATFALGAAALWRWGSARITVTGGRLRAGRAVIPLHLCAGATPLDADAARLQRGPLADARAYLLLRPYIRTGVRVDLADPRDPTPYWLLSSRHPADLANAVRAGSLPASH